MVSNDKYLFIQMQQLMIPRDILLFLCFKELANEAMDRKHSWTTRSVETVDGGTKTNTQMIANEVIGSCGSDGESVVSC